MDRNNIDSNTSSDMTALTPEYFVKRWSDPQSRPLIKGKLIDENGRCCAQGDVLHCSGYSDRQLRDITQKAADREVARLLGISLAESVLIRIVNDSTGRPQDVFQAPEKVLGPHHRLWTVFVRHIEQMSNEDWTRVAAARAAAGAAAGAAAWDAARGAAWAAAGAAAGDAAWYAAWYAAGDAAWDAVWAAAGDAAASAAESAARATSWELLGWSQLKEPFFLKMFFDDPQAWVKSIEEADGGAA